MQEQLLAAIGGSADEASVPFWVEHLGLRKARDRFATMRRRFCVDALALLAVKRDSQVAFDALLEPCTSANSEDRAACIDALWRAHHLADRPVPGEVFAMVERQARDEPDFLPRYFARRILWFEGRDVPEPQPAVVYRCRVSLLGDTSFRCEIDVGSDQHLSALHDAIQDAFCWDADHLYAFYLGPDDRDDRCVANSPHSEDPEDFADVATLGQMGLARGVAMKYVFDFGDYHVFPVTVVKVVEKEPGESYPREHSSTGVPPEQYAER